MGFNFQIKMKELYGTNINQIQFDEINKWKVEKYHSKYETSGEAKFDKKIQDILHPEISLYSKSPNFKNISGAELFGQAEHWLRNFPVVLRICHDPQAVATVIGEIWHMQHADWKNMNLVRGQISEHSTPNRCKYQLLYSGSVKYDAIAQILDGILNNCDNPLWAGWAAEHNRTMFC